MNGLRPPWPNSTPCWPVRRRRRQGRAAGLPAGDTPAAFPTGTPQDDRGRSAGLSPETVPRPSATFQRKCSTTQAPPHHRRPLRAACRPRRNRRWSAKDRGRLARGLTAHRLRRRGPARARGRKDPHICGVSLTARCRMARGRQPVIAYKPVWAIDTGFAPRVRRSEQAVGPSAVPDWPGLATRPSTHLYRPARWTRRCCG